MGYKLPITNRFSRSVKRVCKKNKIKCRFVYKKGLIAGSANQERRSIIVPFPVDLREYTVAMHEIGHLMHPLGAVNTYSNNVEYMVTGEVPTMMLRNELCAWIWATENSPIGIDIDIMWSGLGSYLDNASESSKDAVSLFMGQLRSNIEKI